MQVPYSYLPRQFAEIEAYLQDLKPLVDSGDFTLGAPLTEFEASFAEMLGAKYAIGVGSGTDALILSLKALGVGPGDEVITCANTFVATLGAIAMAGAKPVLVDATPDYLLDTTQIEAAITEKTKAILPVHYTGNVCRMSRILQIAKEHRLAVVEDACQCILGERGGTIAGTFGETGCYSLHPLKNLNVWGDGGVIVTNRDDVNEHLRLLRNHGLINRDEVKFFGHNSRLDTLHAVIGNRLIKEVHPITDQRIQNAAYLDDRISEVSEFVTIPERSPDVKHVYHLYVLLAERRDELLAHLHANGVEAKVHYPIPMHLQEAARYLEYPEGSFPVTEHYSKHTISLPAHQHLTDEELAYMADKVIEFYS